MLFQIARLKHIGGKDANQSLRNVSQYLLSDHLLEQYSWTGTTKKQAFNSLKGILTAIGGVTRATYPKCTDHEIATFFKEYLKHATTRNKRRFVIWLIIIS